MEQMFEELTGLMTKLINFKILLEKHDENIEKVDTFGLCEEII